MNTTRPISILIAAAVAVGVAGPAAAKTHPPKRPASVIVVQQSPDRIPLPGQAVPE